ncbi:DUF6075 family protein [Clostridium sp. BSD9I1]|uniref:DUF6075 family protein n=1 Tax=Clostridium sp. BSD9I1 TaxID=2003589 RepID=UPI0016475F08|nr:DUF6075 family protein [Clostridium sp. BSD9I1]
MKFLNKVHEERFLECISKDRTCTGDVERYALFYILTGSNDIWWKGIDKYYDFKEHGIKSPRSLGKLCLCNSSLYLVKLAYNLYNGYKSETVLETFSSLDKENTRLALNAIKIRLRFEE